MKHVHSRIGRADNYYFTFLSQEYACISLVYFKSTSTVYNVNKFNISHNITIPASIRYKTITSHQSTVSFNNIFSTMDPASILQFPMLYKSQVPTNVYYSIRRYVLEQ